MAPTLGPWVVVRNTFLQFSDGPCDEEEPQGQRRRAASLPAAERAGKTQRPPSPDRGQRAGAEEEHASNHQVADISSAVELRVQLLGDEPPLSNFSSRESTCCGTNSGLIDDVSEASCDCSIASFTKGRAPSKAATAVGQLLNAVTCEYSDCGTTRVRWEADGRRLNGSDKMAVSPEFQVLLPGLGLQPFRMLLYAASVRSSGQSSTSFRATCGRGRVELKCAAQLPSGSPDVGVSIGIGCGERAQHLRGPVVHSFLHQSCCRLHRGEEEWDFRSAVNGATQSLVVLVEVVPVSTARAGAEPRRAEGGKEFKQWF